jgi:hypothetical protein
VSRQSDEAWATYHVMREADGTVFLLLRLRHEGARMYGEVFAPGAGWVEDVRAFDVLRNGQDYDLIDEREAERLIAQMPAGATDT